MEVVSKKFFRSTLSSVFILPLTMLNVLLFKNKFNVYCRCEYDKLDNEYCNRIYVVYKEISKEEENSIIKSEAYVKTILEDGFTIFVYKVLDKWQDDYNKFLLGQYSKTSNKYKLLVYSNYGKLKADGSKTVVFKTLEPTKTEINELKKLLNTKVNITEVRGIPDIEEETFNVANFLTLEK